MITTTETLEVWTDFMKNAHERFGKLVYVRRTEKASTNIRVHLDAFIGEERGKAHFVSVIGGYVEIGAIAAAFSNGDLFTAIDPTLAESIVSQGDKPLLFRGSIAIAGRKRPLRHLVACSQEMAETNSDGKLLLLSNEDSFIWSSLVSQYGLPATPEWGAIEETAYLRVDFTAGRFNNLGNAQMRLSPATRLGDNEANEGERGMLLGPKSRRTACSIPAGREAV